ncbi:MAG TPA: aminoglycoside adenylyltransferase domain-containing protein [Dehalococcoidia bacterium]
MPPRLPPQVRETLGDLADGLRAALGERLTALYLGGSAVLGSFHDAASDLDFLAVIDGPLAPDGRHALAALHDTLRGRGPYGDRLDGAYVPRELLTPEGASGPVPSCRLGRFAAGGEGAAVTADVIYHVREQGFTLHGAEPKLVLPRVTEAGMRAALQAALRQDPAPAATPEAAAAALLDMLRRACTLELGRPVSRADGAAWALATLDAAWHPAVRAALAVREGRGTAADGRAAAEALPGLHALVRSRYG